jgi:isopropylmalate/homocitrate/citramalate synthase
MYSYGGSHLGGILRGDWYFWENIRAETVGNVRSVAFGPTSLRRGKTAPVTVKIETMGFDPASGNIERVFEKLERLIYEKVEISEPEVEAVIREYYQQNKVLRPTVAGRALNGFLDGVPEQ